MHFKMSSEKWHFGPGEMSLAKLNLILSIYISQVFAVLILIAIQFTIVFLYIAYKSLRHSDAYMCQ